LFELLFEAVPLVEVMQSLLLEIRILESAYFGDETQKNQRKVFRSPYRCGVSKRLLERFFPPEFLEIKTTDTSLSQTSDLGAFGA
jgi:hypothetical protein